MADKTWYDKNDMPVFDLRWQLAQDKKTEEQIEEDLLPFGFIDTGNEVEEQRPGFQPVRSWM
jgi:hypothetical protein